MNVSERILRLVEPVGHPGFRVTLDVGNFLCVDEDPLVGVPRLLPHASVVHLKDFHIRDASPGDGWLTTVGGHAILGAVFGSGDLPARELLRIIAASGFDGPVSLEFEGLEDSLTGITDGLAAYARNPDAVITAVCDIDGDRGARGGQRLVLESRDLRRWPAHRSRRALH